MKKLLQKRKKRGQKNLQLYDCAGFSECSGCGSGGGVRDFLNVQDSHVAYRRYNG